MITVTGDPRLLSQQEIFAQLREALALTGDGPPVGGGDPDGPMAGVVIHDTFIVPRSPAAADEAQQQVLPPSRSATGARTLAVRRACAVGGSGAACNPVPHACGVLACLPGRMVCGQ